MAPTVENAVQNTDGKPVDQHQIHSVGSKVWVSIPTKGENEENEWYPGEVYLVEGELVHVRTDEGQEIQTAPSEAPLQNATGQGGMEDMTKLSYLHEPGVLHNLDFRYSLDEIYTYTGNILIAVNPFQRLPHLYDSFMMEQYKGIPLGDLSPHVFAVADEAYRFMRAENKSQSILVSGESGAGKTETTKLIMQYLAFIGGRKTENSVEQQLLESNPVLEAFGNAKTIRNDNSSRFGKFMEIQFNSDGHITGAAIRTYLLERSRVVQVNDPERNYHIFYQLADGASEDEKKSLFLGSASDYRYLNSSTCFMIDRMDNAEELQRTKQAMSVVGIGPEEQEWIFKTVAAILHLGNCDFHDEDEDTAKLADSSLPAAAAFAKLMEVSEEELHAALLTRKIVVVGETTTKPLSKQAAIANRDALAKKMYSLLFDWLVTRVNKSIGQDPSCAQTIGVLDIYGFESFKKNSFEQFCINLANEKLQQHFNQHVFKMEQQEYIKEEIDWSYIDFVDNQDVLDLIEGKHTGVLAILDEQCKLGVDHYNFAEKLYQSFVRDKKKHDPTGRFAKPKVGRESFIIRHYAGSVAYSSEAFLEKNKDFVVPEHQRLLGELSSSSFVRELFTPTASADAGSKKRQGFTFLSVGTTFKTQLQALMETLSKTEPHYIRCIKPNSKNKPSIFEKGNVLHQLRCGGVLEAIRISCAGYPTRKTFEEFLDRFLVLAPDLFGRSTSENELAGTLLSRFKEQGVEGFQLGRSKVFLRAGQLAILDKLRSECLYRAAVRVQRHVRGRLQRKKYQALRQASVIIQSHVRANKARSEYRRLKETRASIIIQKNWRCHICVSTFRRSTRAATLVQAAYRGHRARSKLMQLKRLRSTIIIQSYARMYKARKVFLRFLEAALTLQGCFRCSRAKTKFKKLKAELNAKDALLDKNAKLAKEIAELQRSLNQEKQFREQLRREAEVLREEVEQKKGMDSDREKELLTLIETEKEKRASETQRADEIHAHAKAMERELQASNLLVQTEIKTLQQENESLKTANGELHLQLEKLENSMAENKTEVLDLHEKLERLESENMELRSEVKETKDALSLAEASAQSKEEKIILLQHEISKRQTNGNYNTPIIKIPSGNDLSLRKADIPPLPSVEKTPLMNRSNMSPPSSDRSTPSIVAYASKTSSPQSVSKISMESAEKLNREMEKRAALQNALIGALSTNLGFSNGRPMAACIIFKSLMYWRALENDSATALLDQIYRALVSQVEMDKKSNSQLTYWLSNVSSLLSLIQQTVKSSSNTEPKARRRTSILLGRWNQLKQTLSTPSTVSVKNTEDNGYIDGNTSAGTSGKKGSTYGQIDAKYSVIVFKMQITKLVEKIYTQLRDNLKEAITPLMGHCIQAPKQSKSAKSKGAAAGSQSQALVHWVNVVVIMNDLLESLKMNHCAPFMSQKLFDQLFQFMNTQLFNSILLKKDCCSFSNGEYVKTGLAELEHWIESVGTVWIGSALDELKYIRQAVSFLVVQKSKKSFDEIQNDLCPALNVQQLYSHELDAFGRLATYYWDDKYGTETVSPEVLRAMKKQMLMGQNSGQSPSFLITDDDSRDLPFTLEDIAKEVATVDLRELPVPEQLGASLDFAFLHDT